MEEQQKAPRQIKIIKNISKGSDAVYAMGFIGAAIYYIQHATSFWNGVVGVIKAVFWPGFIMYKLLEYFKF